MKYIIDIPDDRVCDYVGSTHLLMPYTMAGHKGHHDTGLNLTPYTEPDHKAIELQHAHDIENVARLNYNKGAEDGWDLAKLFALTSEDGGMSINELLECFGYYNRRAIFRSNSYQEAKSKYEAWKKQKNEIRVGDEVTLDYNVRLVVVTIDNGTSVQGIDENGECFECIELKELEKTGRHFDEIEELLKRMKEK